MMSTILFLQADLADTIVDYGANGVSTTFHLVSNLFSEGTIAFGFDIGLFSASSGDLSIRTNGLSVDDMSLDLGLLVDFLIVLDSGILKRKEY